MSTHKSDSGAVTVAWLRRMKRDGIRITSLTAYDAAFAALVDAAGIDLVLVGDSLGMVVQGLETTVPVTMEDMIYHARLVRRGLRRAMLMVDMPFMSYATPEEALRNGARLMKEAGAEIIKLEWGAAQEDTVHRLAKCGIPVCAHLGLQPQSVHKLGGYRVQGRDEATAARMLEDARTLEQAGADILLLECVPTVLARRIVEAVRIPVIGIGAGPFCDGQILVLYDILDIAPGKRSRFSENFMAGADSIQAAVAAYVQQVRDGEFPRAEHSFE
ncbi:MAG: 3-methyl-2-oxobutanoate hydroxymethyltransferase [Candidatus Competibacterales bacterium]|nr:3-methyl-2-oxobutanoate hydroxymethyltransferase [Candidatus Competibacterales bacterium]